MYKALHSVLWEILITKIRHSPFSFSVLNAIVNFFIKPSPTPDRINQCLGGAQSTVVCPSQALLHHFPHCVIIVFICLPLLTLDCTFHGPFGNKDHILCPLLVPRFPVWYTRTHCCLSTGIWLVNEKITHRKRDTEEK